MLVDTLDLLHAARRTPVPGGVLACNVIGLEHAEAIVAGAEAERAPIILQISQNAVRYHGGVIEPIAAACRELAASAAVPVALHLDHATTQALSARAADAGFSSIMFDASTASHEQNIARTAEVVGWAHRRGLRVEGEIGIVGGKDGVATTVEGLTDPADAAAFVAATGVDTLAVAVGSEHGMTARHATLDLDRIDAIRAAVDVPLVLHGASGVPATTLAEAVRRGITKVNIATQLNQAWTGAIRTHLAAHPDATDPRTYGKVGRAAMEAVVRANVRLVGASGRA